MQLKEHFLCSSAQLIGVPLSPACPGKGFLHGDVEKSVKAPKTECPHQLVRVSHQLPEELERSPGQSQRRPLG